MQHQYQIIHDLLISVTLTLKVIFAVASLSKSNVFSANFLSIHVDSKLRIGGHISPVFDIPVRVTTLEFLHGFWCEKRKWWCYYVENDSV